MDGEAVKSLTEKNSQLQEEASSWKGMYVCICMYVCLYVCVLYMYADMCVVGLTYSMGLVQYALSFMAEPFVQYSVTSLNPTPSGPKK